MKNITTKYLKTYLAAASMMIVLLASASKVSEKHQKNDEQVKVKVVRIIDGDTTIIEKTMKESEVKEFTKQFENNKGKNVQLMVTVEGLQKDKMHKGANKKSQCMNFNFEMDSALCHSFCKAFILSDSTMSKHFTWNDSMMKNLPKHFDFNFDFDDLGEMKNFDININSGINDDDDKTIIIKKHNGKTVIINSDDKEESANNNSSEKEKRKTVIIKNEKGDSKKKVIVSTSVVVIDDMDKHTEKKTGKSEKEETNFSFYPNPSDGNFTLDLDLNDKEDALISITDITGREVYSEKVQGSGKTSKSIDLGEKSGTFIVLIKQGKKTISKKIIIE